VSGFEREALAGGVGPNPVADLEMVGAAARMKTGPSEQSSLVFIEHREGPIRA
jgi:hypothetical protein